MSAKKKTKKQAGGAFNPDAVGIALRSMVGEGWDAVWRIGTGVVVLALIVSWALGRSSLREAMAAQPDLIREVRFESPAGADASSRRVPVPMRDVMVRVVTSTVIADPFDRDSLVEALGALRAWGWFEEVTQVRREPGGVVLVEASWREPRAFVVRKGSDPVLVGRDGAPMRVDAVAMSGLVTIVDPLETVPRTERGSIAYGRPWGLSDVTDAIALLDVLAARDLERFIDGIVVRDPSRMVIVTTSGARITWGGQVEVPSPGEGSVEGRLALLDGLLRNPEYNRPGGPMDITTGSLVYDARPVR